jgi:hypothetical protein
MAVRLLVILFFCGLIMLFAMITTIRFPGRFVFDPPLVVRLSFGGAAIMAWSLLFYLNRKWHGAGSPDDKGNAA